MSTFITVLVLLLLVVGGIAALVLVRRRSEMTDQTPAHQPWQAVANPTPVPGPANRQKARVVRVNGSAPALKVPVAKPPVVKVTPSGKPSLFAKATKKPGYDNTAHVTKVINVPALCPICGGVDHAAGCPRKQ